MDTRKLEVATEFCKMVGSKDLLEYLGLPRGAEPEQAREALRKKRSWFQSMQGNPKYRQVARYLIQHYRELDDVLGEPDAHVEATREHRIRAQLPLLEMAVDSVLVDGIITPEEVQFVRESAATLGISDELTLRILRERAEARGVSLPVRKSAGGARPDASGAFPKAQRGAEIVGWWDQDFSRMLVATVPEDTRRLVDLATGMAWGAFALLPERPELEYLGIENDRDRIELAKRAISHSPIGHRVALLPGDASCLPIPDGAVDVVLAVMALHQVDDLLPVLSEAARVLRSGGRMIAVEPSRQDRRTWFDGALPDVDEATTRLLAYMERRWEHVAEPWRPGLSLGPRLAASMARVGLQPVDAVPHVVDDLRIETMEQFTERLDAHVAYLRRLGGLDQQHPAVQACLNALARAESRIGRETLGAARTLTPIFLVWAVKP